MHDTLKIIISTLVLIVITTVVFFALYFLSPSISEDIFGISYRMTRENPLSTMPTSVDGITGGEDPGEALAAVAEDAAAQAESGTVALTDKGQEVLDFLETSPSAAVIRENMGQALENLDTEEAKRALNEIGDYLASTGQSIADVFSNRNVREYLADASSSAIGSVLSFFGGN